jgi:alkylated DNA repair dioxygenase AlkB
MAAPVKYIEKFVPNPDMAFVRLRDDLTWERRGDAPRSEYYCNDFPKPYVYGRGRGRRLYEPRPYHPVVLAIRKDLEALCKATFEVCFLNRYLNQSDQLGWHADDSPEMDDARPIVTVSLGVAREIWFRSKPAAGLRGVSDDVVILDQSMEKTGAIVPSIEKLLLGHGSAAIMEAGMQDTHEHRIPKASFMCGERISLTFRGYVNVPETGAVYL